MAVTALYAGHVDNWPEYAEALPRAFARAGVEARLTRDLSDTSNINYIIYAPNGPLSDFAPYKAAKAVLSLWAGVEKIVDNPTLTQPLCRMVDAGLTRGMTEWVVGHVMRHHLGMDLHIHGQDGVWRETIIPPLAPERPVGILGLGELGADAGRALAGLGFAVSGWSRSPKELPCIACETGPEGLAAVLASAEILVLLLPQTPETRDILDAAALARMPRGAVILNPGRGTLIDDGALIAALDDGRIGHATLDVFRTEPLPPDHPYWAHPRVTVTPHIASATRAETASDAIAENIARGEAGKPFLFLVDRARGY